MKNQRRAKKVTKKEMYDIMDTITADLIRRFNCDIDDADEVLTQLEMMCLIMNKANRFKHQPQELLEAFHKAFPKQKSERIVSTAVKKELVKTLSQKTLQN